MKLTFILLIPTSNTAQNKKYIKRYINAGPMVGAPQMREVTFWVQLRKKAKVQIQYWEVGNKKKRYSTAIAQTLPSRAYVVHLRGDCLQPGKVYEYQLLINNRKIKWPYPMRFQTPPLWYRRIKEAPNFRFALGSCAFINDGLYDYKGKPYGGDYQIFSHIYTHHPQFMLWLGDNVYFRESDWTSRTGMIYRYTHDRSIPELQPLLNCSGHIAIWDDHDFGPNDSSSDFILKDSALATFQQFWANPSYGTPKLPGVFTQFQWSDCEFFLLDNRYYRTANFSKTQPSPAILGKEQLDWLINALVNSKAKFKFIAIGGQVLNTAAKYETYIHVAPQEREELIGRIHKEDIKGVIFLTGDRHHSEINILNEKGYYPIYEFTISPLTSGTADKIDETNTNRIEGSLKLHRAFGIIDVFTQGQGRMIQLTIYNANNQLSLLHVVKESDFIRR